MSRYTFHAVGKAVSLRIGTAELETREAVLAHAEDVAAGLVRRQPEKFNAQRDRWRLRVLDDSGAEVLTMPFSEVVGDPAGQW